MKPPVVIAAVAALTAVTVAGIVANSFAPVGGATRLSHFIEQARAEDAGKPVYFQDPDGKPLYSLTDATIAAFLPARKSVLTSRRKRKRR